MKTKQVPITITLIAGFVTCVIGFATHMETAQFVKVWVSVAKLALDKMFKEETEEATDEAEEGEDAEAEGSEEAEAAEEAAKEDQA